MLSLPSSALKRCSFRLYTQLFVGGPMSYCVDSVCIVISNIMSYLISSCSEIRVVMTAATSAWKWSSDCLYSPLLVGGWMSCIYVLYLLCIINAQYVSTTWVTCRVSYKRQKLLIVREHYRTSVIFVGFCFASYFCFVCLRPVSCVLNVVSVSDCHFGFF